MQENKQRLIAQALKRVLKPFVRLMLAHDMGYNFVMELMKRLFVEVAEQEFKIDGKRQTDARISLMTGVHRKDVKRLREEVLDEGHLVSATVSLGSQLIALWNANPRYLDERGVPRALPRFDSSSEIPSFEELVRSVSKDIHPRAILDEWLRLGIAKLDAQDNVALITQAFVPEEGFEEKMFYFSNNIHDHTAAAVSNVLGGAIPFFERCVHYQGLSEASIHSLKEQVNEQGMVILREINRVAAQCAEHDGTHSVVAPQRMTCGVYFYYAPVEEAHENKES